MKNLLLLNILIALSLPLLSQTVEKINPRLGLSTDYSLSGFTHSLITGPAMFWEKKRDSESGSVYAINLGAGFSWSKHRNTTPLTSIGYYMGNVPGFVVGLSSQQYYRATSKYGKECVDIRLSGEIIFALFGFLGYRFQYPLFMNNEAQNITRHAFLVRIPIPLETLPPGNDGGEK